jgi:hypothetical protein
MSGALISDARFNAEFVKHYAVMHGEENRDDCDSD